MFAKIATKYTAKFSDVIQAIENRDDTKLRHFKEAGILSSKVDPNGHSVLLHYLTQLSDPFIDPAPINSHLSYFAQQCPAEIWEQFKFCALQATKTQNYDTLKRLIQSYGSIKSHLQQRQLIELQSIYSDIFSLIIHHESGEDDLYKLLAIEEVDSSYCSKLESSQVIDCILEWSHNNAFPWALEQNSKALYSSLKCEQRISMNIFDYCYNHFLDHQRQAIVSLYQKLYLTAASMGYCALLTWLNQYETLVDLENFQTLLKSALIKTSGCNTAQITMLITKINQLNFGLLLDVFVKTINDSRCYIYQKHDSDANNTTKIMDYPELICDEVTSIEFLLQTARKNGLFSDVLKSAIDTLKETKSVENLEENMKLLLVALALHYTRPSTAAALSTIEIQDLLLNDTQLAYLITTIISINTRSSVYGFDYPCVPTSLNLSGNDRLGYYTILALSQLISDSQFTCVNLSNNPLGCGYNRESCMQTFLHSLSTSKSLHTLALNNTQFGDADFRVLAKILEVDSTLIVIDLSDNISLTLESEIVLMELLLKRNKLKLPLLSINLSGTGLRDCNAKYFLSDENKDSSMSTADGELIERFKKGLEDKAVVPKKRASHLNGIVLEATRSSRSGIVLTELRLTDDEGYLLIQQFRLYSHIIAPAALHVGNRQAEQSDSPMAHGSDASSGSTSQIRFLLSLSNNSLGYRFLRKLSECLEGSSFFLAVLDLSNNSKLGGGGKFYPSSGVQLLAKSLKKNTTLQKLSLAECGVNDYDFETLIDMLTVNSHVIDLDLTRNRAITTKEINSKLPNLYKDRYKHHKPAVRLLLDFSLGELNAILNVLGPIELSEREIFRKVFKRHLTQLENTTFGIQTKFEDPHAGNLSFLTFAKHALHGMAAIATITGAGAAFVVPFASITLVHALQEGAHHLAEGFEKVALAPQALETIVELYELYGETKEKLEEYCHEYGITKGIPKAIIDLYLHIRRLYTPENQKEIRLLSQKLKVLSIVLSVNRTAANFAHDFSDTFSKLFDPLEVILLANYIDQCFSSFSLDPNIDTNCSTFTDDFSHWLIAKELECHEVLKIKKEESSSLVIFTGSDLENKEEDNLSMSSTILHERSKAIQPYKEVFCEHSLKEQFEYEWAINIVRRRGFQCYGTNNCIIKFDLEFIKSSEIKEESKDWTKTEGERYGYRPIGKEFLRKIKDTFDTYQNATSSSVELRPEVFVSDTSAPNGVQSDLETVDKSQKPAKEPLVLILEFGVTYRIPDATQLCLKLHKTLSEIPSGYQSKKEKIKELEDDTLALKVSTETNKGDILKVREQVGKHSVKHMQLEAENIVQAAIIVAQGKRIGSLESTVGVLELENKNQHSIITRLEGNVNNLTASVAVLLGRQGQAIVEADHAAQNAERAGGRAEGQDTLGQGHQMQENHNNRQEVAQGHEVPLITPNLIDQGNQAGGEEVVTKPNATTYLPQIGK